MRWVRIELALRNRVVHEVRQEFLKRKPKATTALRALAQLFSVRRVLKAYRQCFLFFEPLLISFGKRFVLFFLLDLRLPFLSVFAPILFGSFIGQPVFLLQAELAIKKTKRKAIGRIDLSSFFTFRVNFIIL